MLDFGKNKQLFLNYCNFEIDSFLPYLSKHLYKNLIFSWTLV